MIDANDGEHLLDLPPGSLVTLLTDTQVINLRVVNVRKRTHCVHCDDIPPDAHVLGVEIERPEQDAALREEA